MTNNRHFVFVIGTRAQLIKVAPIIVECEKRALGCTLLMTGQHQETMQDLLDEFGVRSPQVAALPAKERSTIFSLFAWLPQAYRGIVKKLKALPVTPQYMDVLVHGDTLSTVLGAIAGKRVGARVVHLESGLTSKKLFDPFPEEIARRIVFRLSHMAMCPNEETLQHIQKNYPRCTAINTGGNTILDAIRLSGVSRSVVNDSIPYLVASLHRFQNIYEKKRLNDLVKLLQNVAINHRIKFVLHPATRKRLKKTGLYEKLEQTNNIELVPRLGYSAFLKLAAESACVLTDGGSNQEELAAIGVPTIIMRQATERSDGLGGNAIMEGEIRGTVEDYIKSKKYQELEAASTLTDAQQPSVTIVESLLTVNPCKDLQD